MSSESLFVRPSLSARLAARLAPKRRPFRHILPEGHADISVLWTTGIRLVLSLLILTILVALAGGVVKTFLDIRLLLTHAVEDALRQIIVDTLILLAVVEVFKTAVTYFSEGRVKVTFIVDTILVVMLTEVISLWFKGSDPAQLALLGAILLTLGAMRIVTVRWSPAQGEAHGIS